MKRTIFNYYQSLERSEKIQLTKIERDIQGCIINIKKDSFEIGQLLYKAKKILPHGSFNPWIRKTFKDDLPYSTANFYMRIYETFQHRPGVVQHIPTKYLLYLTQRKFPEEALQIIKDHIDKNESIERWQLEQVNGFFDLMKEGAVGGNKFLQQVKQIIKDGHKLDEDSLKNQNKHRMNRNARRSLNLGLGDLLGKLDSAISQAHEMAGLFPFDPNDSEHQKVIKLIHTITGKLQKLEIELTGGGGMFKPVSTEKGTEYL